MRADRGLAHRLVATDRVEVLVDEADVAAVEEPPTDTRAWFRAWPAALLGCRRRGVVGLGDLRRRGPAHLQRVPMLEPLKGTEEGVGDIVRSAPDAASLLEALARNGARTPSAVVRPAVPRGDPRPCPPSLIRARRLGSEQSTFRRSHHGRSGAGQRRSVATTAGSTTPPRQQRHRRSRREIDDILDEIDGVLESNAEEFVRGFVQKGGQ